MEKIRKKCVQHNNCWTHYGPKFIIHSTRVPSKFYKHKEERPNETNPIIHNHFTEPSESNPSIYICPTRRLNDNKKSVYPNPDDYFTNQFSSDEDENGSLI